MLVIDWNDFIGGDSPETFPAPLAVTIGVFDGLHLGHRSLIRRILDEPGCLATAVTFRQNPLKSIRPNGFAGDIFPLERKLSLMEELGVGLVVLIDFSREFGMMNGRDFIELLLVRHKVKLIALGADFRCGHGLDVGAEGIREFALAKGVETWIAPPVMDGGRPISSSRIRQALASGHVDEAERLLGGSGKPKPADERGDS